MPPSRRTVIRLLIGLLLVAALTSGLWWNSTRLNETERQLVGVWMVADSNPPTASLMLADGREYVVQLLNGRWEGRTTPTGRWRASPETITFQLLPPISRTPGPKALLGYWLAQWHPAYAITIDLNFLPEDQIRYAKAGRPTNYSRSTDPQLLAIFDRLTAGESP